MRLRFFERLSFQIPALALLTAGYALYLSPLPQLALAAYLREAGFQFQRLEGHPLFALQIDRVELEGSYGSWVLSNVRLRPRGVFHALSSRSIIFETIEVDHARIGFDPVLGRTPASASFVRSQFDTLGALAVVFHEVELKIPLKEAPVKLESIEVRNWVTDTRSLTISQLELESPSFSMKVSDRGSRIGGLIHTEAAEWVRDSIPFEGKIERQGDLTKVDFSLFNGQWQGRFNPESSFEVAIRGWTPWVWLNTGLPIQDVQAEAHLYAGDIGGRLNLRSFLLALLSDAIDIKAQFRIGNRVYKNEAQRLANQLRPVMLTRTVASAAKPGLFRPNSLLFQSEWSGTRDTIRLIPRLFQHKDSHVFEVLSTAVRSREDFLSRAIFERRMQDLGADERQVVEQAVPYFRFQGLADTTAEPLEEEPAIVGP